VQSDVSRPVQPRNLAPTSASAGHAEEGALPAVLPAAASASTAVSALHTRGGGKLEAEAATTASTASCAAAAASGGSLASADSACASANGSAMTHVTEED